MDLEISAIVDQYSCYISPREYFCSCMDNFIRKTICKHIIASVLKAYAENKISEFEMVNLLIWR